MGDYVTELRDSDVLFGRGSGPNDHEGNIRFRQYVAERKTEYLATNHRLTKAKIAREIVDIVLSQQGRFLKKMEAEDLQRAGLPDGTDAWIGVDEDTIMEKAKQALRQNTSRKSQAASSPTPPPMTSLNQQHQQQSSEPRPLQDNSGPSMVQYGLQDLEPIPLPSKPVVSGHSQRPSQLEMPPPMIVSSDWQAQQRQQRLIQAQQHHLQQQQFVQQQPRPPQQPPNYSYQQQDQDDTEGSYPERDSMLAYVPSGMMQPHVHQRMPSASNNISDPNLEQEEAPVRNSLRGSLTIGEVFGRESLDMSQLMSSFQSTKISGADDSRANIMASTETMGTIEPIPMNGGDSVADMSIATMNSSTFSILKGIGDDSLAESSSASSGMVKQISSGAGSFMSSVSGDSIRGGGVKYGPSDGSLSYYDLTGSVRSTGSGNTPTNRRGSTNSNFRASLTSTNLEGVKEEDIQPLPMGDSLSSSFGASAMSMLKGMVMSQDDVLAQANSEYQEQQQQQQQQHSSKEAPYGRG
eukprot:scaffold578_cov167-Amphora_coffeaeformis.AAC.17